MNTSEFIKQVRDRLSDAGWRSMGFNGTWLMFQRGAVPTPLPLVLLQELAEHCLMDPIVEAYLVRNGWRRVVNEVNIGLPVFSRRTRDDQSIIYKTLPNALLMQLEAYVRGDCDNVVAAAY